MEETPIRVSEESTIQIPLRNLLGLLFGTAVGVLGYAELNSRITTLEHGQTIQDMTIRENASFVREWPLGLRGSLPDDLIQDAKIMSLEGRGAEVDRMRERMNELQIAINKTNGVDETQNQKIETIVDIWNNQLKE